MRRQDCVFTKPISIVTGSCELCVHYGTCLKIQKILSSGYDVTVWWDDKLGDWRVGTPVEKVISDIADSMAFEEFVKFVQYIQKSTVGETLLMAFNAKQEYTAIELTVLTGKDTRGRRQNMRVQVNRLVDFGILKVVNSSPLTVKLRGF